MIKLRGHHLLCLQFFEGKGYSESFVAHIINLMKRLKNGEHIKIVEGKDEVCNFCPNLADDGRCKLFEKVLEKDKKVLDLFGLNLGDIVSWHKVIGIFESKKELLKKEFLENICKDCLWKEICIKYINQL